MRSAWAFRELLAISLLSYQCLAIFDSFERIGDGFCLDRQNRTYDTFTLLPFKHYHCCLDACMELSYHNAESPGFHITPDGNCSLFMNNGHWPLNSTTGFGFHSIDTSLMGSGKVYEAEVAKSNTVADGCWRKREYAQNLSENESTNGFGSEGETKDYAEEDFSYCVSAGAIPGPAILDLATSMDACWRYCSDEVACQACFRDCTGNCSQGCTYYAVQFCTSTTRSDCGVRSIRRKVNYGQISSFDDVALQLALLLLLFCVIQGVVLFCYWRGWIRTPLSHKGAGFIDEQGELLGAGVCSSLPAYWSHAGEDREFSATLYVGEEQWQPFTDLLEGTYRARSSQDRPCPSGTCAKTQGGCRCVQADGEPGLPAGYVVRRVLRMEKSRTWQKYAAKRAQLRSRQQGLERLEPVARTEGLVEQHPELFAPLETDVNEVYLWHGTHIRSAFAIAHEDFKMGMAGSNGTMYGKGIYFAENSTKADEYARDEPHGFYQDVFALLLCRVCLGKFLYSEERLDTAGDMAEAGTIDSTVGDRTRTANTFREFAAYHPDQVYPEYVVLYSRRPKAVAPEPFKFSLAPLHAQLPIYWQHFHVNPQVDSFEVQYGVRHASRALLEQLAQACYPGGRGTIQVISARRIEMSSLWNRYVQFKKRLRDELDASGRSAFASPELLEGQAQGGEILTHRFLKSMASQGVVQTTISADSLEGDLQEHLLWHGTSRKSAEAIVRADFRVPKDVKNGVRFGCGLYFAEDVGKSLTYAPVNTSSDGRTNSQFLLLCRVLCGQMHYTSERYDLDAVTSAHKVGKHSVLANPLREGPREVIIWHAMQVYPEYILEVAVDDGGDP